MEYELTVAGRETRDFEFFERRCRKGRDFFPAVEAAGFYASGAAKSAESRVMFVLESKELECEAVEKVVPSLPVPLALRHPAHDSGGELVEMRC